MKISWSLKKFDDLTPYELYNVLQLRNEVFVVEQNCAYQDADNKDSLSFHFMGWKDDKLVAYTRIIPPGISYEESSIGRVVSSPSIRGTGIGRELMHQSISQLYKLYGNVGIKIGAQLYLIKFYSSFGFIQTGEVYLEDGIKHIEMIKPAPIS